MMKLFLATMAVTWSGVVCEAPYSFITLGDWGGVALGTYHAKAALAVAEQMGKTASDNNIKFVVNVGDNFYYCGIQNTSDPQINQDYLDVYKSPSLQVPWYSALGNHEYGYNVQAQIDFTKVDPSKRWYMPARYYTKRVQLAAQQHLTFIVLDTNPCIQQYRAENQKNWDPCGSQFPSCDPVNEGPCKFHENILAQECGPQLTWLKAQLKAVDKDDWLIIVAHHTADEIDVEDMTSEIQAHGFDLYLNGHVHTLQQYTIDNKGAYVTSGAGAMVHTEDQDNHLRCPEGAGHTLETVWEQKTAGFTLHSFSEDFKELKTEFVSYTGEVIRSFTITKGASPTPSPTPGPPSPTPGPPSPTPGPSGKCPGAGKSHCAKDGGCTYVHKHNEGACNVAKWGCYDCATLPSGCPDCQSEEAISV